MYRDFRRMGWMNFLVVAFSFAAVLFAFAFGDLGGDFTLPVMAFGLLAAYNGLRFFDAADQMFDRPRATLPPGDRYEARDAAWYADDPMMWEDPH